MTLEIIGLFFSPFMKSANINITQSCSATGEVLSLATLCCFLFYVCHSSSSLALLKKTNESHYVTVELGLQSFFDHHLTFLQRGHDTQRGYDEIIQTAQIINELPISNVKLHNLHVLTKTPLADMYQQGQFQPVELDEYIDKVILFLEHLSPDIAVQRLAAVASRWDELIAPQWTKEKMRPTQMIEDRLLALNSYQGIKVKDN